MSNISIAYNIKCLPSMCHKFFLHGGKKLPGQRECCSYWPFPDSVLELTVLVWTTTEAVLFGFEINLFQTVFHHCNYVKIEDGMMEKEWIVPQSLLNYCHI